MRAEVGFCHGRLDRLLIRKPGGRWQRSRPADARSYPTTTFVPVRACASSRRKSKIQTSSLGAITTLPPFTSVELTSRLPGSAGGTRP
jgi:hypothetical protein